MVKIDLITGFLGSGKTTFIKKYAKYLLDKESITGEEFMAILNGEAIKETNTETKIESGAEKKEADADEQTI